MAEAAAERTEVASLMNRPAVTADVAAAERLAAGVQPSGSFHRLYTLEFADAERAAVAPNSSFESDTDVLSRFAGGVTFAVMGFEGDARWRARVDALALIPERPEALIRR